MMPTKEQVFRALLRTQPSFFVHFDPSAPQVLVPQHLATPRRSQLVFQFGESLPIPIRYHAIDSFGVVATLSFKGVYHDTQLPWAAVFAMVGEDAKGVVWDDAMPEEVRQQILERAPRAESDIKELKRTVTKNLKTGVTYETEGNVIRPRFGGRA